MTSHLLAVNWEPELRGILIVIIGVVVLCGSVYLILGTNIGARLGFLVAFAGLAGWMFLMGAIWWIVRHRPQGPRAVVEAGARSTVIQDPATLHDVRRARRPVRRDRRRRPTTAASVQEQLVAEGWTQLDPAAASFGQAAPAADGSCMDESGAFAAGEFTVVERVRQGRRALPDASATNASTSSPSATSPHYALVEVRAGRAAAHRARPGPARAVVDTSRSRTSTCYMVRDLGREAAARRRIITIGSLIIFLILCWLLHRRDRTSPPTAAAQGTAAKA